MGAPGQDGRTAKFAPVGSSQDPARNLGEEAVLPEIESESSSEAVAPGGVQEPVVNVTPLAPGNGVESVIVVALVPAAHIVFTAAGRLGSSTLSAVDR